MNKRGFTLIELLVVISIISLLSSVVLSSLSSAKMKARDTRRIQDLIQLRNAIEMYRLDNGIYPDAYCSLNINDQRKAYSFIDEWKNNTCQLATNLLKYIPKLPVDPINIDIPTYAPGARFYFYYKSPPIDGAVTTSDTYYLCTSLEIPKSTNPINPLGTDYQGDSSHMFNEKNGGFCFIGK